MNTRSHIFAAVNVMTMDEPRVVMGHYTKKSFIERNEPVDHDVPLLISCIKNVAIFFLIF